MSEVFVAFLNYLDQGEQAYPWQVLDSDFADTLADGADLPLEMGELDGHSARFLAQLDQLFPEDLQFRMLHDRLGGWLPPELCQALVIACRTRLQEGLDLAMGLRRVLEELLPQWSPGDLDILLRSYGGALRGGMGSALPMGTAQSWAELSALAQAQYLAAIAHCYLTELTES